MKEAHAKTRWRVAAGSTAFVVVILSVSLSLPSTALAEAAGVIASAGIPKPQAEDVVLPSDYTASAISATSLEDNQGGTAGSEELVSQTDETAPQTDEKVPQPVITTNTPTDLPTVQDDNVTSQIVVTSESVPPVATNSNELKSSDQQPTSVNEGEIPDQESAKNGWVATSGGIQFWVNGAQVVDGWRDIEGGRYYFSDGYVRTGWQTIDNGRYYFDPSSGKMSTGWTLADGRWARFSESGAFIGSFNSGWTLINGTWYYLQSGYAVTGWKYLNYSWFYLDPMSSGAMLTGWQTIDGSRYYLDPSSGAMRTGWVLIDNTWFYLDGSGAMRTGWLYNNYSWYYLDPSSGAMRVGWVLVDGKWYYLGTGAMRVGWIRLGGTWYYLDGSGAMRTGWLYNNYSWYYLDPSSGAMRVGWINLNGTWYWLSGSGAMVTGTHYIDGKYQMFDASGRWIGESVFRYPDMQNRAQQYSSRTGWLILVDTNGCRLGVYQGRQGAWTPVKELVCSTGAPSTPTIRGQFTVTGKGYSFGSGYTCYYYTQFFGDYLIHSIKYNQGTFNVQDGRLGQHISHGCVRLPLNEAKWIYDTVPYGTTVVTY